MLNRCRTKSSTGGSNPPLSATYSSVDTGLLPSVMVLRFGWVKSVSDGARLPTTTDAWERFLNPDVLRPNLVIASLYIAAFEVLKSSVVDRVKTFFSSPHGPGGFTPDPEYQTEVMSRNKSPQYASVDWLRENAAIDDNDIAAYERVKQCRNELAHQIPSLLMNGFRADMPERFAEMIALVDKIERWWILNVEIPINPDFDGVEIDEAGIASGPVMALRLLTDIALGPDDKARFYFDKFVKQNRPAPPTENT